MTCNWALADNINDSDCELILTVIAQDTGLALGLDQSVRTKEGNQRLSIILGYRWQSQFGYATFMYVTFVPGVRDLRCISRRPSWNNLPLFGVQDSLLGRHMANRLNSVTRFKSASHLLLTRFASENSRRLDGELYWTTGLMLPNHPGPKG
jgi:hypothetical protein